MTASITISVHDVSLEGVSHQDTGTIVLHVGAYPVEVDLYFDSADIAQMFAADIVRAIAEAEAPEMSLHDVLAGEQPREDAQL